MRRFLPPVRLVKQSFALALVCIGVGFAYMSATKSPVLAPETLAYIEAAQATQSSLAAQQLSSDALEAAEAMAIGAPQELACESESVLCIGVVTGLGRVDDQAMNQKVWELVAGSAADWSTETVTIQVDLIETARIDDLRPNIELLAELNYDLIVTIGSQASGETKQAAIEYSEVEFIGILQQSDPELTNYRTISGEERDVAYSSIVSAAAISEEGKVGLLLPPVVDPNYTFYESGAAEGALASGVELVTAHQPTSRSGSAATWAPYVVSSLLEEEIDVLVVLGLADERGVLEVIGAIGSDLVCIGHGADWWDTAGKGKHCLVTSIEIDVADPLSEMIVAMVNGEEVPRTLSGSASFGPFRLPKARPDSEPIELVISLEELEALARESIG